MIAFNVLSNHSDSQRLSEPCSQAFSPTQPVHQDMFAVFDAAMASFTTVSASERAARALAISSAEYLSGEEELAKDLPLGTQQF